MSTLYQHTYQNPSNCPSTQTVLLPVHHSTGNLMLPPANNTHYYMIYDEAQYRLNIAASTFSFNSSQLQSI